MTITHAFDEDDLFDDQLPRRMRVKSDVHFTPVAVARKAAALLAPRAGMRILDVGAGPGKFCVVAAIEVPSATFVGVELRPHLVHIARRLAARTGVPNVSFVEGNALELDWSEFDAFYFYNPFGEHVHAPELVLDRSIPFAAETYRAYVAGTYQRLSEARAGTRVVTYHGIGGTTLPGYDLIETHVIATDQLDLWIKGPQS